MFVKILVGLDGSGASERALDRALALAFRAPRVIALPARACSFIARS